MLTMFTCSHPCWRVMMMVVFMLAAAAFSTLSVNPQAWANTSWYAARA